MNIHVLLHLQNILNKVQSISNKNDYIEQKNELEELMNHKNCFTDNSTSSMCRFVNSSLDQVIKLCNALRKS